MIYIVVRYLVFLGEIIVVFVERLLLGKWVGKVRGKCMKWVIVNLFYLGNCFLIFVKVVYILISD